MCPWLCGGHSRRGGRDGRGRPGGMVGAVGAAGMMDLVDVVGATDVVDTVGVAGGRTWSRGAWGYAKEASVIYCGIASKNIILF